MQMHTGVQRPSSRSADPAPAWLIFVLLLVAVSAASVLFLSPSYEEFPMDDAYIHLVYARNLAEDGKLYFNVPGEPGVGTSSVLWTLLLAGGAAIGWPVHLVAKGLGILSLAVVGVCIYSLLRPTWGARLSVVCATLVALSGNMVWYALSGMETTLFLALGLLAILAYRQRTWWLIGALLGLATLTRIEGAVLLAAIVIVELLCRRRVEPGLIVAAGVWSVLCAPWFGFLLLRTGHLLPTSGIGKHFTSQIAMQSIMDRSPALAVLASIPGLVYVASSILFLFEFNLGGHALPSPTVTFTASVGSPPYTVSVWAMALWLGAILPLLWAGGRRLFSVSAWKSWILDRDHQALLAFGAWVLLHNLSFMAYLPVPGTAGRYGAPNHLVLWMGLVAGLSAFARRRLRLRFMVGAVALLAVVELFYWDGVYDANLDHMNSVRIAAARYVREEFPPPDVCAAFDIGAVRYHSQRPIVDLGGLIEPEAHRWLEDGAVDQYLLKQEVTCLVVPSSMDVTEEGWFDLLAMAGVKDSKTLGLGEVASFSIDYDRWLRGYLATTNYQASVDVYRLMPLGTLD